MCSAAFGLLAHQSWSKLFLFGNTMTPQTSEPTNAAVPAGSNQVLTFTLGNATYGVDILRVQEIRGWSPVTRIPQSPAHVLGVLNLRGSIVPIVDLRMRFNLERAEYTPLTVIIVLSVQSAVGRRDFGVVVDGVSDVIDVAVGDVKPAPELGTQVNTEFISGLAAVSGRMLMLLDIDQLIGGDVTGVAPMPAAANG
jgi:purine-binding chemotaxis protein CheW